jgi:hypothetical protein
MEELDPKIGAAPPPYPGLPRVFSTIDLREAASIDHAAVSAVRHQLSLKKTNAKHDLIFGD